MNWSLIAAGVMAGLSLVIAKQWFDRRLEGQDGKDRYRRRRGAGSASAHGLDPHPDVPSRASVAAVDAQTPALGIESSTEDIAVTGLDTEAGPQGTSDELGVAEALASGDLSLMERLLRETEDPIHRHTLLKRLVAGHYRRRSDPEHREAFYRVVQAEIEEASAILRAFEVMGRPRPDHIDAFKSAAIALAEDGRYDEAVAICEKALSLGLVDGTKTEFEGRIARLNRHRGGK